MSIEFFDEVKVLFASEARTIASNSNYLKKMFFKLIREASNHNMTTLEFRDRTMLRLCDKTVVENTINDLKAAGYKVKEVYSELEGTSQFEGYNITW